MPEVDEFADAKDTLLAVDDHPIFREETEDLTEVHFVLLFGAAGNENVVEVDENEGDVAKDAIHQPLKCLGGILEPKGHAEKLPEPEGSDDGRLGDVCRCYGDLVVAAHQVHLGEDPHARQAAVEILYVR